MRTTRMKWADATPAEQNKRLANRKTKDDAPDGWALVDTLPPGEYRTEQSEDGAWLIYRKNAEATNDKKQKDSGAGILNRIIGASRLDRAFGGGGNDESDVRNIRSINDRNRSFWGSK